MTLDRMSALKSERALTVDFLATLSEQEWNAPSLAAGWTVKDVVSHMGGAAHGFFTPWMIGLLANGDIEKHNDRDVEKRRDWAPAKVQKEFVNWSKRAGVLHALLQKPVMRSAPIRLAEAGVYPGALMTSAITFDTGLHLRHDIAGALGRTVADRDANVAAVSTEWMMAGLAPMSDQRLTWLDRPVELNLVGAGGGTWTIAPGGKKGRVKVTTGGATDPVASIEGDATTFPLWGTRRQEWREADLSLKGDEDTGAKFLDTMKII
jgi:uncharacterized protein (TIGR03083 family)